MDAVIRAVRPAASRASTSAPFPSAACTAARLPAPAACNSSSSIAHGRPLCTNDATNKPVDLDAKSRVRHVHIGRARVRWCGGTTQTPRRQHARALLHAPLPRRWAHVQGVAARARDLSHQLGADADLIEAAAWLYDIGYGPGPCLYGPSPIRWRLVPARYPARRPHAVPAGRPSLLRPSSKQKNAALPTSYLEFEPAPDVLSRAIWHGRRPNPGLIRFPAR